MGRRGPKPTPTAILESRGSWRAKTRKGEPKSTGRPTCPDWLPERARPIWQRAADLLDEMKVLGQADENALARYALTLTRWLECEQFIEQYGMTQTYKKDGRVVVEEFPQVARASRLSDQLLKIEQQFGMTPSARVNLTPSNPAQTNSEDGIAGLVGPRLAG